VERSIKTQRTSNATTETDRHGRHRAGIAGRPDRLLEIRTEKVADAKADVAAAKQDVKEAVADARTDAEKSAAREEWLKFKSLAEARIAANDKIVADYRGKMTAAGGKLRANMTRRSKRWKQEQRTESQAGHIPGQRKDRPGSSSRASSATTWMNWARHSRDSQSTTTSNSALPLKPGGPAFFILKTSTCKLLIIPDVAELQLWRHRNLIKQMTRAVTKQRRGDCGIVESASDAIIGKS